MNTSFVKLQNAFLNPPGIALHPTITFSRPTAEIRSVRSRKPRGRATRAEPPEAPAECAGAADQLADLLFCAGRASHFGVTVAREHQSFKAVTASFTSIFVDRHRFLLYQACRHDCGGSPPAADRESRGWKPLPQEKPAFSIGQGAICLTRPLKHPSKSMLR